jgi:uncharacterized glyoxalase superfamily protein PhnB
MGTVPARVNLITLGVADVARATGFYESLGWERSAVSQDTITFLRTTGAVVALYGREALAEDAAVEAGEPSAFSGITLAINHDSREAADATAAAWVAAGGRVVKPLEEVFWGGYSGYVADLDGHLWELAHNPFISFREDGTLDLP